MTSAKLLYSPVPSATHRDTGEGGRLWEMWGNPISFTHFPMKFYGLNILKPKIKRLNPTAGLPAAATAAAAAEPHPLPPTGIPPFL